MKRVVYFSMMLITLLYSAPVIAQHYYSLDGPVR